MGLSTASKLLWTLLLALSLTLLPGATPESTVTEFVQAMNGRDFPKAAGLVKGGKPAADYSLINGLMGEGMHFTLGTMKTEMNGNTAKVTATVLFEMTGRKPSSETEVVNMIRVDDNWLIVPDSEGKGMITSMASVTTNPSAVFQTAKKAAKKTACLSNVKQLAVAVFMFLADHDDQYKFNPSKIKAALHPYTKNDSIWFCPAGAKTVPAYSLNTNLIGRSEVSIQDPANTVMMYEGSKGKLDFRHDGAAAVAFADGHAKIIKEADAKKLNWKP